MRDVSQTNPHTPRETVNRPFVRGPVVAAAGGTRTAVDGGTREAADGGTRETDDEETEEEQEAPGEEERQQMRDVDHTPPHGDGANRVFERGGKEEPVEPDE